jgi:hypothetical protein
MEGKQRRNSYDDASREPLHLVLWIEKGPIPLQPDFLGSCDSDSNGKDIGQARVERAVAAWRATPHGNEGFFRLALECKRAGMDVRQVEKMLQIEAEFARSPSERKSQIDGIIESLRKGQIKSFV